MKHTHRKSIGVSLCILVVIVGVYFTLTTKSKVVPEVLHQKVPYEVQISADTLSPRVGQKNTIRFAVAREGKPVDLGADMIYPHASVVSHNLSDVWFYHIDELHSPSTGVYEFTHIFTQATDYTVWIEINDNKTPNHHGTDSDYISKFVMHVENGDTIAPLAPATTATVAKSFVADGTYTLEIPSYSLTAGQPGTVPVVIMKHGKEIPLLPHFDHFYILASPSTSFYTLAHPQMSERGETKAILGPLTFSTPGKYALWIRLFPDNGSGKVTDVAEGTLILEVK